MVVLALVILVETILGVDNNYMAEKEKPTSWWKWAVGAYAVDKSIDSKIEDEVERRIEERERELEEEKQEEEEERFYSTPEGKTSLLKQKREEKLQEKNKVVIEALELRKKELEKLINKGYYKSPWVAGLLSYFTATIGGEIYLKSELWKIVIAFLSVFVSIMILENQSENIQLLFLIPSTFWVIYAVIRARQTKISKPEIAKMKRELAKINVKLKGLDKVLSSE